MADFVDRNDVGVVKVGNRLGLVLEATKVFGAGKRRGPDQFNRDQPVEFLLTRSIDDSHPPSGDFPEELILAE